MIGARPSHPSSLNTLEEKLALFEQNNGVIYQNKPAPPIKKSDINDDRWGEVRDDCHGKIV